MRRQQGKQFGDQGGERRFGGRGQDFRARSPRGENDRDRRGGDFNRGPRDFDRPRGGDFRGNDERGRGPGAGGFDRRPSFSSDRPRGTYRRPDGAQGGYGAQRPSAPFAPRAPQQQVAPAAASCVSAQQLKAGIGQANRALAEVIEQFGTTLRGDYDIGAIEVTVGFAEDGRFLGFGAGGAASMKLSLTPLDAESVVEGDDDDDFVAPEQGEPAVLAADAGKDADQDAELAHFDA